MTTKPPAAYDLKASHNWLRYTFGVRGEYGRSLRHVNRCLDEIASYEATFLLFKSSCLSCMDRWKELARLLRYLLKRFPQDPEVHLDVADFFKAHGEWKACWEALRRADRHRRILEEQRSVEFFLCTKLECLHGLGRTRDAVRMARRELRRRPRLTILRGLCESLEKGRLSVEPWAPARARYLKELKRATT